jgi:undecaprenyl-diphosphatase
MKFSLRILLINLVSLIIFFSVFLEILNEGALLRLDHSLPALIEQIRITSLTSTSIIIDIVFDLIPMIAISILLSIFLLRRYCNKFALFFAITVLFDAFAVLVLKELVKRPRPLEGIISKTDFAFPSGHTANAVVFFGFLTYLVMHKSKSKTIKGITISLSSFMIFLIGISRIYLNAHWLTDVIGGFGLGLYILTGSIMLKEYTGKLKCASKNNNNSI